MTRDECVQAVTLHGEGVSYHAIGLRLGFSHTTISRAVQRYRETNSYNIRPKQGRPRVTTAVQDRFIRLSALRERFTTSRSLLMQLRNVHNVHPSIDTVRRRLTEANLRIRVPARGPLLNADHRRARLQFAREHVNWTVADWENVLFTDESRFCLYSSDRRLRVIRRAGERYAQCNIRETTLFNGGSIMFWGGISLTARTDIVPLQGGSLNSERYINDILSEHVIPFAPYIGNNFLLMHDNARPHVARVVREYLDVVNIQTLNWPPHSPDLNPIEHLWDIIGRQLRQRQPPPATLQDIQIMVMAIWRQIDQNQISNLISSMPRRCAAAIRSRGGNTRY